MSSRPSSSRPSSKPAPKAPVKKPGYDFAFAPVYLNALPQPPFAPKLLRPVIAADAPYRYDAAAVAALQTFEVLPPDVELGMPLDIIEMGVLDREAAEPGKGTDFGNPVPESELSEIDRTLLWHPDAGTAAPVSTSGIVTKRNDVFLRSTQYISSDTKTFGSSKTSVESQMGLSVAKLKSNLDRSPSGQIAAIKRTFDRVKEKVANLDTLKHERKPHLKAVAAYPIFPDFEYWTNPYVTDVFLDDPTGRDIRVGPDSTDVPKEENDRAVLRIQEAVFKSLEPNDGGRPFLAMYLPDATSFEKLLIRRQAKGDDAFEFGEGEKFDYEHIRNYDYEVERKASRLVAVAIRENSALYMLTQGNLRLRRRRAKAGSAGQQVDIAPSKLTLQRREWTEADLESKRETLSAMLSQEDTNALMESFALESAAEAVAE